MQARLLDAGACGVPVVAVFADGLIVVRVASDRLWSFPWGMLPRRNSAGHDQTQQTTRRPERQERPASVLVDGYAATCRTCGPSGDQPRLGRPIRSGPRHLPLTLAALAMLEDAGCVQGYGMAATLVCDRLACQRFARNCATRSLASPHDPTLASAFHLLGCVGR